MARDFLPYNTDQQYLLPPDMREWVPEGHLIWFLSDVVDGLDLSAILCDLPEGRPARSGGLSPRHDGEAPPLRLLPGQDLLPQDRAGHL